jgi:chromosome segregation ATPase
MDTFKDKRTKIQNLQNDLQQLENILSTESTKEAESIQDIQLLEAKRNNLMRELDEQKRKKNRALQFIKKASKRLRALKKTESVTEEEQDFIIRSFREIAAIALRELDKYGDAQPDLHEIIASQMELFGLQPPSRSVSRVSSRNSSIAGDSVGSAPASVTATPIPKY